MTTVSTPLIHIIRHGEAVHNIERGYPHRDPPLTTQGQIATKQIKLKIVVVPDLVVISPMTRTIQTAINAFPFILNSDSDQTSSQVKVQIWPDLRESHDAICNKGLSRSEIFNRFPQFNFAECSEEWDYPPHTVEAATERAERVRKRLKENATIYKNIAVITHRGFIAFLVQGSRYDVCDTRSYQFAPDTLPASQTVGINVDTKELQDFGPTLLIPFGADEADAST